MIYSCKDCGGKISFSSANYNREKWNYFFTKKMEKHHV